MKPREGLIDIGAPVKWICLLVLGAFALVACGSFPSSEPTPSLPPDLELAWDVLISVFDDINQGRYEAVLKGLGDLPPDLIPTLQRWDPTWQPDLDDIAGIIEQACTSGYLCLRIRRVIAVEPVSETEYEFLVEHAREDGSIFILGPCCGANETEMAPRSEFRYRVARDPDGQWRVMWSPIYVP